MKNPDKCLNCGKPIKNRAKIKNKKYCSDKCRGKKYAEMSQKGVLATDLNRLLLYPVMGNIFETKDKRKYRVELIENPDEVNAPNVGHPAGKDQRYDDTPVVDVIEEVKPKKSASPKTLKEIKDSVPSNLKGMERTEWIAKEREKYGI